MRLAYVFLIILFAVGCGQKAAQSPSVAPSASPTANAPASPDEGQNSVPATSPGREQVDRPNAAVPNGVATVAPAGNVNAADLATVLAELTQALRKYGFEHQRLPRTFSEVVAAGYVKNMPQAPLGKKFEIDAKTVQVVLVKQ